MDQTKLFYDSIEDAIGTAVMALGGYKKVAAELWPAMKLGSAYARLKNCLSDTGDQKLSPSEVDLIEDWAWERGCYALQEYRASKRAFEWKPLKAEDEKAKLQAEFVQAAKWLRKINERLEQMP